MAENEQTTAQRIAQGSKLLQKHNSSDLWRPMRIVLDRETIDNAVRRDSHNCMIADAIAEVLKVDRKDVHVDLAHITIKDREANLKRTHFTPIEAQRRLVWFDSGEHIDPWYFHIGKPAQITRLSKAKLEPEEVAAKRAAKQALVNACEVRSGRTRRPGGSPGMGAMNDARHPERRLSEEGVDVVVHGPVDDNDTRKNSVTVRVGGPPLPRPRGVPGQLKGTRMYGAKAFIP